MYNVVADVQGDNVIEKVADGVVNIMYVPTKEQVADVID